MDMPRLQLATAMGHVDMRQLRRQEPNAGLLEVPPMSHSAMGNQGGVHYMNWTEHLDG